MRPSFPPISWLIQIVCSHFGGIQTEPRLVPCETWLLSGWGKRDFPTDISFCIHMKYSSIYKTSSRIHVQQRPGTFPCRYRHLGCRSCNHRHTCPHEHLARPSRDNVHMGLLQFPSAAKASRAWALHQKPQCGFNAYKSSWKSFLNPIKQIQAHYCKAESPLSCSPSQTA